MGKGIRKNIGDSLEMSHPSVGISQMGTQSISLDCQKLRMSWETREESWWQCVLWRWGNGKDLWGDGRDRWVWGSGQLGGGYACTVVSVFHCFDFVKEGCSVCTGTRIYPAAQRRILLSAFLFHHFGCRRVLVLMSDSKLPFLTIILGFLLLADEQL